MNDSRKRHLKQRFPGREERIGRLERVNPGFRELCRDYEDCVQALDELSGNPIPDLNRIKEYQELKLALEVEVLEFLECST